MAEASSSWSVTSYFKPQTAQATYFEAETLWCKFVAEHNLSLQISNHATKLIHHMPEVEKKKFTCGHTKTATII